MLSSTRREQLRNGGPVLVLAATFIAYAAVSAFGFVYDDEGQILHNSSVQHWHFIPTYFTTHVWQYVVPLVPGNYYRPVFMLWLLLNFKLFGTHAAGWHLALLGLHLVVTWQVYRLAKRILNNEWAACAAALLFGLHPVHLEAVAWISGSTEPLAAVFILAAILSYIAFRSDERRGRYGAALAWFALALLSKETAVLVPVLLFAYDMILRPDGAMAQRAAASVRRLAPMAAMIGVYLIARYHALHALAHRMSDIGLAENLFTIPRLLAFYGRLLLYPVGLSAFYDLPYTTSARQAVVPALVIGAAAVAMAYALWRTRSRAAGFALILAIVPLLPLMKLDVFVRGENAHDRYLYLPSVGFALLAGVLLRWLAASRAKSASYAVFAVLAVALAAATMAQSLYWADDLVLYARGVAIAPNNLIARTDLANMLYQRGDTSRALLQYEMVLKANPNFWLARYNVGYVEYKTGDCAGAVENLNAAAYLNPTDAETFFYMGSCKVQLGDRELGIAMMRHGIELEPRMPNFRAQLADALANGGNEKEMREALNLYRTEAKLNPAHPYAAKRAAELEKKIAK